MIPVVGPTPPEKLTVNVGVVGEPMGNEAGLA